MMKRYMLRAIAIVRRAGCTVPGHDENCPPSSKVIERQVHNLALFLAWKPHNTYMSTCQIITSTSVRRVREGRENPRAGQNMSRGPRTSEGRE